MPMTRVFVYEFLSGGGLVDDDPATGQATTEVLLPLGLAMRDAVAADLVRSGRCEVTVGTCHRAGPVPSGAAPVEAAAGESPLDFVARQALGHDVAWIIAPETGGCLGEFERRVGAARWVGCRADAIALATHKGATLAHLARHGVATPLAPPLVHAATRWVVKPDDGAGGVATRVHADHAAAQADHAERLRNTAPSWLEAWIDGDALSVSLLCGPAGASLLSVNRQLIEVDAQGRLAYRGVQVDWMPPADPRRPRLAALAQQIAQAMPGLQGFVGIDLVWHPMHGPVVIEVNPRVTCAFVGLPERLQRCLAGEILAMRSAEAAHA
jgi:tyramine---L-glutamate ligase